MISLDTETNGLDLRHGARPFFVTTCTDEGDQRWWEWDVDPLTRMVIVPPEDLREIGDLIFGPAGDDGPELVLHNTKFDVTALQSVMEPFTWPWGRTYDTLVAGHLLASNRPHNLTDMAVQYLGVDIERFELELGKVCNEARRLARSKYKDWRIARDDMPDLPSVKGDKTWKCDMWLPRAIALEEGRPLDDPWMTALRDYALADSEVTVALWKVLRAEIRRRGLWEIYLERLKLLPISYDIECRGVTASKPRLDESKERYAAEAEVAERKCVNIAAGDGYDLVMGKATNNSLRDYCFGPLDLERIKGKKSKTSNPSLDKEVMNHYLVTLPPRSKQACFVNNLLAVRSRRTAISYMESYERFWLEVGDGYFRLHPSLNMTGTDTLRWSSSNPNEQNISKKADFNLRYCFGPAPGREWWSCDAKNLELRLPAYAAGETEMIDLFERPDEPPYYGSNHLLNFHTVYPDIWDKELKEVGPDKVGPYIKKKYASTWYLFAKNGGFAVQYGAVCKADGHGTADRAFHRPHSHIKLKQRFTMIEKLNRKCIDMANRLGYVEVMPDRTVNPNRGYPLLVTRTEHGRALETVPLSYYIQGTAMQWTNKAMIRCDAQLGEWRGKGFDAFITMQVHDEIVFDLPRRADPRVDPKRSNLGRIKTLQRLMEEGGRDIGIPTPTSCEYHPDNWSEGVSL